MSPRARSASDALTYAAKVWFAGLAAAILVPLALIAAALELIGAGEHLVDRVLRASARLEAAVDVHGEWTHIEVRERS